MQLLVLYAEIARADIVINEFMADNDSLVADAAGDYDDWIELYNSGEESVDLTGYYMSDDGAELNQWPFPDGTTIAAGGYLVIWADNEIDQDGLHANFGLKKSGESIYLVAADGTTIVDEVTFETQTTDVSTGRLPNGTGDFYQVVTSYGAENTELRFIAGDIDGSLAVEPADAILALQVLSGLTPAGTVYSQTDVDGDTLIGLSEVLYILREAADTEINSTIVLSDSSITVDGDGATVDGTTVTITSVGTYTISGTLNDGQVLVDTEEEGTVVLVLSGVNISCSTNAPIAIMSADEVSVILDGGTDNYLTDGSEYVFADPEEDEPNAALFSKDEMVISGSGTLTVTANYNDGITSKDGLTINGGTINVTSVDDGIRGKDYLVIDGADIILSVGGDGLKADNDDDTELGYITLESGTVDIISGGDGIQAETTFTMAGGDLTVLSGGGSSAVLDEDTSAKGVKGNAALVLEDGSINLDSADDALHSDGSITINGGTLNLASGDDAVHGDVSLEVNGGNIEISASYEGLESQLLTISGGTIHIVSNDDGINAAGGDEVTGDFYLYIKGGYTVVSASGDGIDVNGTMEMSGGTVIVHGPTSTNNGALDYDSSFNITGGLLVAAGSSNMAQAPSSSSTQNSVLVTFNEYLTAGQLLNIQTGAGDAILTFAPEKNSGSIVFSSPDLIQGTAYSVYTGGTVEGGSESDGLYEGGTYSPGTIYTSFTPASTVTTVGGQGAPPGR